MSALAQNDLGGDELGLNTDLNKNGSMDGSNDQKDGDESSMSDLTGTDESRPNSGESPKSSNCRSDGQTSGAGEINAARVNSKKKQDGVSSKDEGSDPREDSAKTDGDQDVSPSNDDDSPPTGADFAKKRPPGAPSIVHQSNVDILASAAAMLSPHEIVDDPRDLGRPEIPNGESAVNGGDAGLEDEGDDGGFEDGIKDGSKDGTSTGRWTAEEHSKFLIGYQMYGKKWTEISRMMGTRTGIQIRTHAQKYFQSLDKMYRSASERSGQAGIGFNPRMAPHGMPIAVPMGQPNPFSAQNDSNPEKRPRLDQSQFSMPTQMQMMYPPTFYVPMPMYGDPMMMVMRDQYSPQSQQMMPPQQNMMYVPVSFSPNAQSQHNQFQQFRQYQQQQQQQARHPPQPQREAEAQQSSSEGAKSTTPSHSTG
jgi:SHAQKYF class myb-like DNA-binding protein